jgi:hypothetical protein
MSIQSNVNQLLQWGTYLAQPAISRRKEAELKEKQATQEHEHMRQKLQVAHATVEKRGEDFVPESIVKEHAEEWAKFGKAEFERKPTEESFQNYVKTVKDKERIHKEYEDEKQAKKEEATRRWQEEAASKLEELFKYEEFRKRLAEQEGGNNT